MREYKFRGKWLDNGEWVYGYYVYTHDRHRIIYEDKEGFYCEHEVIPESVGQYAEQTDNRGKEIFEHDIVNFRNGERMLYVAFHNGQWSMCGDIKNPEKDYRNLDFYVHHDGPVEVIGNVYENPELLEAVSNG